MFVPITSAGIRSGVNWMRLNGKLSVSASVRTSIVLPSPGTPSSSTLPPANNPMSVASITSVCPTMTFPISSRSALYVARNFSHAAFTFSGVCISAEAMVQSSDRESGIGNSGLGSRSACLCMPCMPLVAQAFRLCALSLLPDSCHHRWSSSSNFSCARSLAFFNRDRPPSAWSAASCACDCAGLAFCTSGSNVGIA